MRAIHLDFVRKPTSISPLDMILLLAGVLVLLWIATAYRDLQREYVSLTSKLAPAQKTLRSQARRAPNVPTAESLAEAKQARDIADRLNLPWNELFIALETAQLRDVALMAVEPDSSKRSVRINAEARNFNAMLDYLNSLKRGGGLSNVYLENHQIQQQDPSRPLRFGVTANWSENEKHN